MTGQHEDSVHREEEATDRGLGLLPVAIRDVLAHFYDRAYLMGRPLVRSLGAHFGPGAAVERLRGLLLDMIEELRPAGDLPETDPAWRPYLTLHGRYILGQDFPELEQQMGLGMRQLQREQHRGVEALAIALSARVPGIERQLPPPAQMPRPESVLKQEISRAVDQYQSFDAYAQLGRALEAIHPLMERHGVRLHQLGESGALHVLGSPTLFRQLLVAALSFVTRAAGVDVLAVGLRRDQDKVVFSVSTGRLAAGELDDLPRTLRALAEAQGAEMQVLEGDDSWRLDLRVGIGSQERTVVLVEDNTDLAAMLSRYLGHHGYRLITVTEGAEAVATATRVTPSAIVLDVMLRGVDGWELLQSIKAHPTLAKIPVVICSVLDEAELASALGADAYLRKPIMPAQLLECLGRLPGS